MRLVLINQFYPPDVAPTGVYLHDVAAALVRRGHDVQVLCSRRSYDGRRGYPARDVVDGVRVVRLPACGFGRRTTVGKLLDYASFYASLLIALIVARPRPDAILTLTTPPYAGVAARLIGSLRCIPCLHWIMDVYPDVLTAHGILPLVSRRSAMLRALSRFQYRGSRLIVTLGADMARRVSAALGPAEAARLHHAPLWVTGGGVGTISATETSALRRERGWEGRLVWLYSGNVGLGHRIEEFLERAVIRDPAYAGPMPHVVFCGGGRRMGDVLRFRDAHPGARLEVLDYVPAERVGAHLRSADVLLAGLEPAWAGCILPSKVQAAMGSGVPLLYVGPADSDMAGWIRESGAGWVVAPGDAEAMRRAVVEAGSPDVRAKRGAAGRTYAQRCFERTAGVDRMCEWIEKSVPT
jgi:glycosyltransferase involved in cell wall biosynthesis